MNRMTLSFALLLISFSATAEEFAATLDWSQRVSLGMIASGIVKTVAAAPGDQVSEGDLLVALDDRYLKARLARAEAELAEAKQNRAEGGRELERALELYDRTVLSDHDLQMAQIGDARAKAAWRRAQAALEEARLLLQQSRIKAPFSGIVLGVHVQPDEAVVGTFKARTLVEIARETPLIARAAVTAAQMNGIGPDTRVEVDVGGRTVEAQVHFLGLEPLGSVGVDGPVYDFQVIFDHPGAARIGQPVVIRTGSGTGGVGE